MAKLVWDAIGKRLYETGVKRPVLYKPNQEGKYVDGVAWNGFTSVNENPSGAESTPLFANDSKYLSLTSVKISALLSKLTHILKNLQNAMDQLH